jgi:peptidoglycan hydrolase CwlO-like protein
MSFDTNTTITTVIIPLVGTFSMVGIYVITRNKKTEDTTLLNDLEIRNMIERHKEITADIKAMVKQLSELYNAVSMNDYRIKKLEEKVLWQENREESRRKRDSIADGGDSKKDAI